MPAILLEKKQNFTRKYCEDRACKGRVNTHHFIFTLSHFSTIPIDELTLDIILTNCCVRRDVVFYKMLYLTKGLLTKRHRSVNVMCLKFISLSLTDLICEPSHFLRTNSQTVLKNYGASCAAKKTLTDIFYPALDTKTNDCILQQEELLFSCVGRQDNLRRLCPCRDYIKGQTALCVGCER